MNNIIQVIAENITNGFNNDIKKLISEKQDISQLILETKNHLDEIGCMLVKEALEILDESVRNSSERKKNWYVQERNKPNTLATIFGEVHYERTYYKEKETGKYCSLSDEIVGIDAHDKMDLSLKAKCVELASMQPYRKSGKQACGTLELTGQTVMNAIRWLGPVAPYAVPKGTEKKKVKYLFIEADEDHVSMRDGHVGEPKLVYVHEGVQQVSKERRELKNPVYFSGMFRKSEELWEIVEEYIDTAYERENIEKIYLSGDRGAWIRSGATWIKDSIYVVDKFHLQKYIKQAAGHIEYGCREIWAAIKSQDKKYLEIVFETLVDHPDSEGKEIKMREAFSYIRASFETTKHYYDEEYKGCSAEGHVSHILSDRLSSRPRTWKYDGIDEMARLRVETKNGGEIYPLMLKTKKARKKERNEVAINEKIIQKRKLVIGAEYAHNLPYINRGQVGESLSMFRSFRGI